jgi:hypothetical protein
LVSEKCSFIFVCTRDCMRFAGNENTCCHYCYLDSIEGVTRRVEG